MAGYHTRDIQKGVLGEPSKIREELEEFEDALAQGNPVMALLELSDMIGAVQRFLEKQHPSVTLEHLLIMAGTTRRAFESGGRT